MRRRVARAVRPSVAFRHEWTPCPPACCNAGRRRRYGRQRVPGEVPRRGACGVQRSRQGPDGPVRALWDTLRRRRSLRRNVHGGRRRADRMRRVRAPPATGQVDGGTQRSPRRASMARAQRLACLGEVPPGAAILPLAHFQPASGLLAPPKSASLPSWCRYGRARRGQSVAATANDRQADDRPCTGTAPEVRTRVAGTAAPEERVFAADGAGKAEREVAHNARSRRRPRPGRRHRASSAVVDVGHRAVTRRAPDALRPS